MAGLDYLRKRAYDDLLCFILYTKRDYLPNWHHRVICDKLQQFAEGSIRNLIITVPPQHGKSEIASRRFPAWLFGRNPNEHIIACSASTTFAQTLSRDVQRVIDTPQYRDVFPDVTLNRTNIRTNALGSYIRTAEKFEIVGFMGTYKSGGVGSSISGNPATTLLLDDPYGSFADAQSSVIRNKIWDWFLADFMSRRSSTDARVMVIQTRWHEDDIVGQLLQREPERWTHINFPAISEDTEAEDETRNAGEALWPERFPVEELERIKSNAGSYKFAAIYQQRPAPAGGGIFKRNTFKYFEFDNNIAIVDGHHHELSKCKIYACVDLAIKEKETSDFTAAVVFAVTQDGKILIIDVIRERFDALKHLDFVKMIISKWKCSIVGIESTQYQTALIQQCIKAGLNVKELKPDRDKLTRSLPMQAKLESGIVFFLNSSYWLGDFENELLLFPNGKYDDQVDAFSYIAQILAPIAEYKWPFARNENKPQNGNGKMLSIKNKLERPFNG